tara:strand:- start:233 stop:1126 length:894 start_codon:yes stop_codon:yes gene_type:complete
MTICIGLIPNNDTVMLLQDAEVSYKSLGFEQDLVNKIKKINDKSISGVIGNPRFANNVLSRIIGNSYEGDIELKKSVEEAYHNAREENLSNSLLRKYGFSHIREVTQPKDGASIDPHVREEVLKVANDYNGEYFGLELMLASNINAPQLCTIRFPGTGDPENNIKMYNVSGSGSIMAIDKLGEDLRKYRWRNELTIDEGIEILMRAGKESEKHSGVGGPFDIMYLTKEGGESRVVRPDKRKTNMVMYLFPHAEKIGHPLMEECIKKMRDPQVSYESLGGFIKDNTQVGIEFTDFFEL